MLSYLLTAWYLQIPVIIGGVLHMMIVTHNILPQLTTPIHLGLFGANKTWRGIIAVPVLTAFGAFCLWPIELVLGENAVFPQGFALIVTGFIAGIGYVLAELPNSFMKRRLGIAAGETPDKNRWLFTALDQIDSGIGVAIAYGLFLDLPILTITLCALTFPLTALAVKRVLFWAKLKKSAT
ncbi:MAG: CDP-archaeol synthase [Agitococcus sp.]|nr:CDP-archaeol synthase [Agitococcus sp.]